MRNWRTVSIPLAAGEDSSTEKRSVRAGQNVLVENGSFADRAGIRPRNGHVALDIDTAAAAPASYSVRTDVDGGSIADGHVNPPDDFVYGEGYVADALTYSTLASAYPDPGAGQALFTRDDEILALTPGQLRSYAAGASRTWTMPHVMADANIAAGRSVKQTHADSAHNDTASLYCWIDYSGGTAAVMWSIYAADGTPIMVEQAYSASSPTYVRCIATDDYLFAMVYRDGSNETRILKWTSASVSSPTVTTLSNTYRFFDWSFYKDALFVVHGTSTTSEFALRCFSVASVTASARLPGTITLTGSSTAGDIVQNATVCSYASTNSVAEDLVCVAWTTTLNTGLTSSAGLKTWLTSELPALVSTTVDISANKQVSSSPNVQFKHITCCVEGIDGSGVYRGSMWLDAYTTSTAIFTTRLYRGVVTPGGEVTGIMDAVVKSERYTQLASKCWTVGTSSFATLYYDKDAATGQLQKSYFIVDESMKPCGMFEYGIAYGSQYNALSVAAANKWLPSVDRGFNGYLAEDYRKRMVLQYVERLENISGATKKNPSVSTTFSEPSIRDYKLDFCAQLTSGQLGRTTYLPGAMLWAYDGINVGEGAFLQYPAATGADTGGGGSIADGVYSYAVYACRKNAQGELTYSATVPFNVTAAGGSSTITITIPRVITRYDDVFFKIYRTEAGQSLYYLVSDPDPASATCPKNPAVGTATTTFADTTISSSILTNELAPDTGGLLQNLAPSACKYISAAADRLFVWGGAIPRGTLRFSTISTGTETAGFNPVLEAVIDRVNEDLTGVVAHGDMIVVARRNAVYALDNIGPDNLGNGGFGIARVVNQAHGCVSPFAIAATPIGVVYCSEKGIYLFGQQPQHFGWPIGARIVDYDFAGTIVVPKENQIRFYRSDGNCLTFDYDLKRWSTWTGLGCNGLTVYNGRAALFTKNGKLLIEDPTAYTDDGSLYTTRVRTGWFESSTEAQIAVRRTTVIATPLATDAEITTRVYSDDNAGPHTTFSYVPEEDANQATAGWGVADYGSGAWGSDTDGGDRYLDRRVLRIKFQNRTQRCTRVAADIRIAGGTAGAILTHVVYEYSPMGSGTAKIPNKTGA